MRRELLVVAALDSILVEEFEEVKRPYVIMSCGNKSLGLVLLRKFRPCFPEAVIVTGKNNDENKQKQDIDGGERIEREMSNDEL